MILYFLCGVNILITLVADIWSQAEEEPWKRTQLVVVTRFVEIKNLYLNLHGQRTRTELATISEISQEIPPEQKQNIDKKAVCKHIFTSDFFAMIEEDWIDMSLRRSLSELKNNEPGIFYDMHKKPDKPVPILRRCVSHGFKSKFNYENPYKLRNVSVDGHQVQENVFICLVKKKRTGEVKKYLVSEEYNVSADFMNPNVPYVTGRFIFEYDDKNDIVVAALAEEPARVFVKGSNIVEFIYLDRRLQYLPAERQQDDPVCKLTIGERIRLCAAFFKSSTFEGKIKFMPITSNVQGQCDKRKVSFVSKAARKLAAGIIYEEWMIPCKYVIIKNGKLIKPTFYISRAYGSNRMFAYVLSKKGKLSVEYYYHHVNVVLEQLNR